MTSSETLNTRKTFLYDDCCPLCAGYTSAFNRLGWTERTAFSAAGEATVQMLDFDRARHFIPLVDTETGAIQYGLDGILGVVSDHVPLLGPVLRWPPVRRLLDAFYWFVTYNRRHIVTAPPPVDGVDCAPDFRSPAVATYVGFCAVVGTTLAAQSGTVFPVGLVTVLAMGLTAARTEHWGINSLQAAGHVGSVAVAAAVVAAFATSLGVTQPVAAGLALLVGLRKIWLRRWMTRRPSHVRP